MPFVPSRRFEGGSFRPDELGQQGRAGQTVTPRREEGSASKVALPTIRKAQRPLLGCRSLFSTGHRGLSLHSPARHAWCCRAIFARSCWLSAGMLHWRSGTLQLLQETPRLRGSRPRTSCRSAKRGDSSVLVMHFRTHARCGAAEQPTRCKSYGEQFTPNGSLRSLQTIISPLESSHTNRRYFRFSGRMAIIKKAFLMSA